MTRFEAVAHPGVYWAIALSIAVVAWVFVLQARRITRLRAERERLLSETRSQAEALHAQQEALARRNAELADAKREIDRKAETLARANQYQSEFLATMSNELRTPLNSALILSKLLADNWHDNLTPEQVKFAHSIYSAGVDLLELTNDILDLSKIEAREVDIDNQPIALAALVDELAQTFRPAAEQKRIGFSIELAPGLPATIDSDAQRLPQVLKNLLANAVKVTERGSVALTVNASEEYIEFAVRDTGATNRRSADTGLGLAISRELAHLLGGRIELQSAPGQGSTFRLLVPQMPPATPPPAAWSLLGSSAPLRMLSS
jgi:signal transduction histidine kinase